MIYQELKRFFTDSHGTDFRCIFQELFTERAFFFVDLSDTSKPSAERLQIMAIEVRVRITSIETLSPNNPTDSEWPETLAVANGCMKRGNVDNHENGYSGSLHAAMAYARQYVLTRLQSEKNTKDRCSSKDSKDL